MTDDPQRRGPPPGAYPPPPRASGSYPPPPGAYPPPYGPGYPPYYGAPSPPNNGLAIASLVLGIAGLVAVFIIGPILALVFGYVSRRQIDESQGRQGGRGYATAGIVLGWIGIVWSVLIIGLYVWFFTFFFNTYGPGTEFFETLRTPRFGD